MELKTDSEEEDGYRKFHPAGLVLKACYMSNSGSLNLSFQTVISTLQFHGVDSFNNILTVKQHTCSKHWHLRHDLTRQQDEVMSTIQL